MNPNFATDNDIVYFTKEFNLGMTVPKRMKIYDIVSNTMGSEI